VPYIFGAVLEPVSPAIVKNLGTNIPTAIVLSRLEVQDNDPVSSSALAASALEFLLVLVGAVALKETMRAEECPYNVSTVGSGLDALDKLLR
jgi:hypothetical protein